MHNNIPSKIRLAMQDQIIWYSVPDKGHALSITCHMYRGTPQECKVIPVIFAKSGCQLMILTKMATERVFLLE